MAFRISEWPTQPAQVAGEPVVEYLTRVQLLARGWTKQLIGSLLAEPDGTRVRGRGFRRYYRLERVLQAEQTEEFRTEFAKTQRQRDEQGLGDTASSASIIEPLPLAFKASQLRERGWTEELIRQFLTPADDYMPTPYWWMGFRVFAVARVERIETAPEFHNAAAELKRKQEEKLAAWKAEIELEKARRISLRRQRQAERVRTVITAFPGFRVHITTSRGVATRASHGLHRARQNVKSKRQCGHQFV